MTRALLNKVLAILGLGPNDAAYIWTVIEVETAGLTQGFGFRLDRRPQKFFERHIFPRCTNGRFDAVAQDISGPAGGYRSLAEQYNRLDKAMMLCAKANLGAEPALKSASWGVGQVMGFNHKGYNGPSYWQNHFDVKLAEQFQRFASSSQPSLEMRTAKVALLFLPYAPGKIDRIIARAPRYKLSASRRTACERRTRRPVLSGLVKKSGDSIVNQFEFWRDNIPVISLPGPRNE